jgi:hypothetical protein
MSATKPGSTLRKAPPATPVEISSVTRSAAIRVLRS